jgi:Carboxypeptidase regulatory-like domain
MNIQQATALLILLLGTTPCWQAGLPFTSQNVSVSEHEKCVIQGAVIQLPTRDPLKKVEIILTAEGGDSWLYHTETDAAGRFSLSDIEPGKYQIWVSKAAYESPNRQCDSDKIQDGDAVTLVSGQKLSGLEFQLLAPAVVTGTVFDPSGDPVTRAEVEAVGLYSFRGERKVTSARGTATTDDRGQFRLFHLVPGRYFLRVIDAFHFLERSRENEDQTAKGVIGFRPIYYPDTTDISQATIVDLKPGGELAGVDFTIHSAQVLRVRGRAINGLTGEQINTGDVGVAPLPPAIRDNSAASASLDEGDGKFTIEDLVPGRYILSVNAFVLPDRKRWSGWREIDLTDSNLDDIQVKLFPGYDLLGRVHAVAGNNPAFTNLRVILEPRSDRDYATGYSDVKPDGSFYLLDVMPDTYDVDIANLPEGYYLKSAHLGTVDVTEIGLSIGEEAPRMTLMLEVSSAVGQVDGAVQLTNGKPACTATIVLVPDGNHRSILRYYQTTDVDRFGRFVLRGIAPGAYKLFAFDDANEVAYRDPGSLQRYENEGQTIQIDEGDRRTVVLKLLATGNRYP